MIGDLRVKLGPVTVAQSQDEFQDTQPPGMIRADRTGVTIGTGSDPVQLGWVQPPGKKPMAAVDWARGARLGAQVMAS